MHKQFKNGLVSFRRDLRTDDNAALCEALKRCQQVHCVFIFDRDILDHLPRQDRRVEFIRESLCELDASLRRPSHATRKCVARWLTWVLPCIP